MKSYFEKAQSTNSLFVNIDTTTVKKKKQKNKTKNPQQIQNLLAFQGNYVIIELFWFLKAKKFLSIYSV